MWKINEDYQALLSMAENGWLLLSKFYIFDGAGDYSGTFEFPVSQILTISTESRASSQIVTTFFQGQTHHGSGSDGG